MKILSEGKTKCIESPMARHGLEGYMLDEEYRFQRCKVNEFANAKQYYRVYPSEDFTDYYETCSVYIFNKYFKATGEQSII